MALFEGLVVTEDGALVPVVHLGDEDFYVVDDQGFFRHIDAARVDRIVLGQFAQQLEEHRDEAAIAMMRLLGQEDLFTKAMVDSALRNLDLEAVRVQQLPEEARQWLGMLGFRIVIDLHGEIVRVEMPAAAEGEDDED